MSFILRRSFCTLALLVILSFLLTLYWSTFHERIWLRWSYPLPPLEQDRHGPPPMIEYRPGQAKPLGSNYTKTLVIPRKKNEDVSWLDELPAEIERAVYVVDDRHAQLHPPKNKGHEVMVYLTYIIDHYDALPDVAMFMHSHRRAWHNADFFDLDAAQMIQRLSPARVTRQGFMNLRCQWYPGCPDWLHPHATHENSEKSEESLIAQAWAELFPLEPVPATLGTPCCAQFALSRDRVRALPRAVYVRYRDWLLHTPLKDFISGRVWEYVWQFVFTGQPVWCPAEWTCHCDGYGVCFDGDADYRAWLTLRDERDAINQRWLDWEELGRAVDEAVEAGDDPDALHLERPKPGLSDSFAQSIAEKQEKMDVILNAAFARGDDPAVRAKSAGRPYKPGDGF